MEGGGHQLEQIRGYQKQGPGIESAWLSGKFPFLAAQSQKAESNEFTSPDSSSLMCSCWGTGKGTFIHGNLIEL